MPSNTVGITPAANFLPTIWSPELSAAVQANTILPELIDTSWDSVMKIGRVLAIPDRSNPAVRVKSEDTPATWSNRTESQQTITMSRQAYVAFLVEDIAEIQSIANIREEYTSAGGYSLAAYLEGDTTSGLMSLGSAFTQNVGTLGADFADDDLLRAVRMLDAADVPRRDRYLYCATAGHIALLKIDRFVSSRYVGEDDAAEAVKEAMVGRVYGAPVYVSSLADGVVASNQSYNWLGHKRGVALIRQRMPTVHTQYVILETGWGVLIDMIYQFARRLIAPKTLGGGTSNDNFTVTISSQ